MSCKDCNDDCRQGRDCPNRVTYELSFLIKWFIGVISIGLFPFVLVIGVIVSIFYYIPVTVGGWIYDAIKKATDKV
jgi:hypothetical protein